MDDKRKQILVDYISYLYTTGRSYDSIGKYIKYVTDFLENSEEINRRGYYKYKHKNADAMASADTFHADILPGYEAS